MPKADREKETTLRDLFPDLSEEELREAEANLEKYLELAGNAYLQYEMGLPDERRDLLRSITSNCRVQEKNIRITLAKPFLTIANRFENVYGRPARASRG